MYILSVPKHDIISKQKYILSVPKHWFLFKLNAVKYYYSNKANNTCISKQIYYKTMIEWMNYGREKKINVTQL